MCDTAIDNRTSFVVICTVFLSSSLSPAVRLVGRFYLLSGRIVVCMHCKRYCRPCTMVMVCMWPNAHEISAFMEVCYESRAMLYLSIGCCLCVHFAQTCTHNMYTRGRVYSPFISYILLFHVYSRVSVASCSLPFQFTSVWSVWCIWFDENELR